MDDKNTFFKTDIIPSEKNKRFLERFKKLPHNQLLFKPQFVACVIGAAGSGKSSWVYTLINKFYKSYFDFIVVICATADSLETWASLNTTKRKVIVLQQYNHSKIENFLTELEGLQEDRKKKKKPPLNVLLFIDDCGARSVVSKFKPTTMTHILNNRRHWNLNVIMTFQSYNHANQDFRSLQCSQLVVLQVNHMDLDKIAREHSGFATEDEIKGFYKACKLEDPYKPFIIDYQRGKDQRYRQGMVDFFKPGHLEEVGKAEAEIKKNLDE